MKMRVCSVFIFVIGIALLKGVAECSPSLTGLTSICPRNNDTLVLTCRDEQVQYMFWKTVPILYPVRDGDRFFLRRPSDKNMTGKEKSEGIFTGNLTEISNISNATQVADFTFILTVMTSTLPNGTNITCVTGLGSTSTITLTFAEKITLNPAVKKAGSAMFEGTHHNLTQFLATLFKGNAIDYYNISFSIAVGEYSIVNTPSDLTWQHNTTYFNVTAHNCIGQSDSVTVYISNESSRHDNEINTEIKTGEITVPVVAGTAGVLFITFVVVTSIFIYIYMQRAKRKCPRSSNTTHILENIRPTSGNDITPDIQPRNSSPVPAYSYVQVPVVKPSAQHGSYSSVYCANQPTSSQSVNVVGMYSEIGDINGPLSQAIPPPPNDDTVTHFHPDLLQCHDTSVPQPTQPPSNEGSEPDVNEPVKDLDVHPLDKTINGHMILLQLGSVRPHWRTFGGAAGVDEETLDMINADLTEDSEKLAEVVFRWMEQKTSVTWAEIAHLCKLIGFHELSEALNKAYESGILPVEDDAEVSIPVREEAEAPPLPPRDDLECDEAGGSPPPPLPPPLSCENMPPYPDNGYPEPPPRPMPYIPSTD